MKFSARWLREWVDVPGDDAALASRLTMAGLETSVVGPAGPRMDGVVVAEIIACDAHPNADRLRVCTVRTARDRIEKVVCGAANAATGLRVPYAPPGTVLPGGQKIEAAEIRGVPSAGMLLSAAELGLAEQSDGLLELDDDAKAGVSLQKYLKLDDTILEAELTPNRGDCLSIRGLARELAALTGKKLRAPDARRLPAATTKKPAAPKPVISIAVRLDAPRQCASYCGRVVANVRADARTPLWMAERLRRAGSRCIHPIVDVTNYVMLELGQPMHAFDLDRLQGTVRVREAKAGEKIALLDGSSHELAAGALIIADDSGAIALAGIMGGSRSAVSESTTNIFLESAWFRPDAIGVRARAMGLHTDSSHRFERGVAPDMQREAIERATALLTAIAGGEPGPITEARAPRYLPARRPVVIRRAQIARVLGAAISLTVIAAIFRRLGMTVRSAAGGWRVTPPSWRYDVSRECDLIEEVARVHGYEKLPRAAPTGALDMQPCPEARIGLNRLHAIMADRDYQEAITYSFVDPVLQALLDPEAKALPLRNPISADLAVMRSTLWPGLIAALRHNLNRQMERVRLYEIGNRFLQVNGQRREERVISACVTGPVLPPQWDVTAREADFFDLKGDVETLIGVAGDRWKFRPRAHPALHPGQSAEIAEVAGTKRRMGWMGMLHPGIQAELGLDQPVLMFELAVELLAEAGLPVFAEVSRFPSIRRDLAFVVPADLPFDTVLASTRRLAGGLLVDLKLFDLYQGEGIDSGRKSFALALTLQDSSRTLKEDEIEALIGRVVAGVTAETGATLRK